MKKKSSVQNRVLTYMKKNAAQAASLVLTSLIIMVLVVSGPAQAITIGITDLASSAPENQEVSFVAKIDLHDDDFIFTNTNVTVFMTNDQGAANYSCTFDLDGEALSACPGVEVELLSSNLPVAAYGYGYGYGYQYGTHDTAETEFGYGYGYAYSPGAGQDQYSLDLSGGAELIYNITWTTPGVDADIDYEISLVAYMTDGTDEVAYESTSGNTGSITITSINNAPVVAGIPDQTIAEGAAFATFDLDDYLTEFDGDEIDWSYSGNTELIVVIDAQNVVTITAPDQDWHGAETITFTATDDDAEELSDSDSAVFTINPVNDAPIVGDILDQTILEGGAFGTFDLDNFVTEPDNDTVLWSYSGNTDLNVVIGAGNVVTVSTPDSEWHGAEIITFTATDPGAMSDSDAAIFTVTSVPDAPVANNDVHNMEQDTSALIDVLANDADADDDALVIDAITAAPAHGVAAIQAGRINYTPTSGYTGVDTLTYRINDTLGMQDTGLLTINIITSAQAASDLAQVEAATEALTYAMLLMNSEDEARFKVISDVYLPSSIGQVSVAWGTNNSNVIALNGSVTRQIANTSVQLTANLTKGSASGTKTLDFIVKRTIVAAVPDAEGEVEVDDNEVVIDAIGVGALKTVVANSSIAEDEPIEINCRAVLDVTTKALPPLVNDLTLRRETATTSYTAEIPAGTIVQGASNWNGVISLPIVRDETAYAAASASVDLVIDVGSDVELNFTNPVKVVLPGKAGKRGAWARGSASLTKLTTVCNSATAPTNINTASPRECYVDSGSDLVIFTYHFTTFAAVTDDASSAATTTTRRRGSSGLMYTPVEEQETPAETPSEMQEPAEEVKPQDTSQTPEDTSATPAETPVKPEVVTPIAPTEVVTTTKDGFSLKSFFIILGIAAICGLVITLYFRRRN